MLRYSGKSASPVWLSILQDRVNLARQYVQLAINILAKEVTAEPEFFNGYPIPSRVPDQGAALLRMAINIDPLCDTAYYSLGELISTRSVAAELNDNLPLEILWSNNADLQSAVYFRKAVMIKKQNDSAQAKIASLILNKLIVANENDFVEKVIPTLIVEEQAAKIFRYIRTFSFNHAPTVFHVGRMIELKCIVACQDDFGDEDMPDSLNAQAAKLYRQSITSDKTYPYAYVFLGHLVAKGLMPALASDFPDHEMPSSVAAQAEWFFRQALANYADCKSALLGLGRLIATGEIVANEHDFSVLSVPRNVSAAEQAAFLYRKIHTMSNEPYEAILELAELILARKVVPLAQDTPPSFKTVLKPLSFQLDIMVGSLLKVPNYSERAKEFLQRMQIKIKEESAENMRRETAARIKREEEKYRALRGLKPTKKTSTQMFLPPRNKVSTQDLTTEGPLRKKLRTDDSKVETHLPRLGLS